MNTYLEFDEDIANDNDADEGAPRECRCGGVLFYYTMDGIVCELCARVYEVDK